MGANINVELAEKFVPKKMRERGGGGGRGTKYQESCLLSWT